MNPTPVIAGIDEAGRGALAGPVVAGACVLGKKCGQLPSFIRDSKMLTAIERDEAFEWISRHCLFGVGMADAATIDSQGILASTERAMQLAVEELKRSVLPTYLLIDGRDKFWFDYPHSSLVRGDQLEPCISAASIVAKVTRDRIMIGQDSTFPLYGFAEHKGYGAPMHFDRIREHGICAIHRKTYLKNFFLAESVS